MGAGIVGASIAMHLARSGAHVVVFEKMGPAQGATQNSFAWVNVFVDDGHYRALRMQSLLAYRELDRRLSLNMVWGGYVDWASNAAEAAVVRSNAAQLAGTAYPARSIGAEEFTQLDPNVNPGHIAEAIYSSIDAHLDPVFVTRRFLDAAAQAGAKILYPCELTALEVDRGRFKGVVTSQGRFALDRLVVAAGVDRILTKIGRFLPGAQGVRLDRLTLGFRPMPIDEFPVMGALPNLRDIHVAVTHSGVTLAPIVGRLTAEEVLHGSRAEMFARPTGRRGSPHPGQSNQPVGVPRANRGQ